LNPPYELESTGDVYVGRDGENRLGRAEFGDTAGGSSGFGEGDDGGGSELFGNVADGFTDGIGNRSFVIFPAFGEFSFLGFDRDSRHSLNGFNRINTYSGFIGEHHRVGTIKDRIGNVGNFGASPTGIIHHTIQHLGSSNNRNSHPVGCSNQLFLDSGDLFGGHFDAEIATCYHDSIAEGEDRFHLLDRFVLLNFSNDWNFFTRIGD